jgi:hypothetical protein
MRVVHERCCGLDIHKKFVVACLLATESDGTVHSEVRTRSAAPSGQACAVSARVASTAAATAAGAVGKATSCSSPWVSTSALSLAAKAARSSA